jgi:hypothetical protein
MPKIYEVNGQDTEFFTIGELADKLDRQRQTLRKWEREGTIPQAQYRSKTGRRLYTKQQIDAIIQTVDKYGLKQGQAIPADFKTEVFEAFKEASVIETELQAQQA